MTLRNTVRRGSTAAGLTLLTLGAILALPASSGCLESNYASLLSAEGGASTGEGGTSSNRTTVEGTDPSQNELSVDARSVNYRSLDGHPGCTLTGIATRNLPVGSGYDAAERIPGYRCAAKVYPVTNEDTSKPILLLLHGNGDAPSGWESYAPDNPPQDMLVETAQAQGFRVIAIDQRIDLTDDPTGNTATQNAQHNIDHGWAVPIAKHFFESVFAQFPDRDFAIVGFSLGPTIIRDALRRMHRENQKPYERIRALVLCSGANHGVSTFRAYCGVNPTMAGRVTCELGDRTSYKETDFHKPLNGPNGYFETPCLDGDYAFGQSGVCGGHKVSYTTITMKDTPNGPLQDEFVSEGSAALKGASNLTVPLTSPETSGYFGGLFKNHYSSVRSQTGIQLLMTAQNAPAGS